MRLLLLGSLLCGGALLARAQQPFTRIVAEDNVNSRYIVEDVELAGDPMTGLSRGLRDNLHSLIGERFNAEELQGLALQLRKELHLRSVTPHVTRGSTSDQVKVVFEVKRRSITFDISVPKFLYHSKQGWSAQAVASTTIARNHNISFGIVSDGDELTERFAGIATRYENTHVGSDRVRFGFQFESYHEQWNRSTLDALSSAEHTGNPALYRARQNYQPTMAFALAKALTLTVGAGFQQMDSQMPDSQMPAIRSEAANAFIAALHYRRREEARDANQRDLRASYELRAGTKALGSDYIYSRHRFAARYALTHNKQIISDDFTAGYIAGHAPLFERFVLGTSSLLRGWNRYAIDPLGGNRLVHNSITYGYRFPEGVAEIFYDAGALWNRTQNASARHSLGVGFRQNVFSVAVAFPIREGRIDPIFMVGMNY